MSEVEVVITLIMFFFVVVCFFLSLNGSWKLGLGFTESRADEKKI